MKETYTCTCGEKFHSKEELKAHNLKIHGDEMAEAVDSMKPDQDTSK